MVGCEKYKCYKTCEFVFKKLFEINELKTFKNQKRNLLERNAKRI